MSRDIRSPRKVIADTLRAEAAAKGYSIGHVEDLAGAILRDLRSTNLQVQPIEATGGMLDAGVDVLETLCGGDALKAIDPARAVIAGLYAAMAFVGKKSRHSPDAPSSGSPQAPDAVAQSPVSPPVL